MRSWLFPPQLIGRATEATPDQVVATGAAGGSWGTDPVDNDAGWRPAGSAGREIPPWTNEKARIYSVAAYRSNPMARAIIDTYTSFCVGDSGVTYQVTNPQVRAVVEEFWEDPRNQIGQSQELGLRSNLLLGETIRELMVGPTSGVVRYSPIEPATVAEITLTAGNPLWPDRVWFRSGSDLRSLKVAAVDDATGLRDGEALFWAPFRSLETDVRSAPFLMPILDWLDSYGTVLSNLIDRTALARFAVDRAVAARRLPATVEAVDPKTGQSYQLPASRTVMVTGPEIAAADAEITAQVLLNLSTGLEKLRGIGALTEEATAVAARKAWEDFVGVPYTASLDSSNANPGDLATHVDANARLKAV